MNHLRHIILAVVAVLACLPLRALEGYAPNFAPADTAVSFVIFMPGPDIYELEGHAALRLQMPQGDYAVSFGTFDFDQPNFVYRFVKGETDYWAIAAPWDLFVRRYMEQGRAVYDLRLDLTPAQKARFVDLVSENLREENRTYRYNYVKDNCATRPLGLLRKAVPGLKLAPVRTAEKMETYREVMSYYHRNYPWYQFGIDLALGSGIDYKLSNDEFAFAPVLLLTQLQGATAGGKAIVSQVEQLNPAARDATEGPTRWFTPDAVASLLLIMALGGCAKRVRDKKRGKVFDSVLFGLFGLMGCVITFLVFVSVHEATSPNWLILWANPLCFIMSIGIWIKSLKKVVNSYIIVNFALVLLMAVMLFVSGQRIDMAIAVLIATDLVRSGCRLYINLREGREKAVRAAA